MNVEAIKSSVESLQQVYTVILALSLGEAFMQFVNDKSGRNENIVNLGMLPGLIGFLALLIPFFQGMNRYFYEVYIAVPTEYYGSNKYYGNYLIRDCILFTIEASIFFMLSRSMQLDQWKKYYKIVIGLLFLDVGWGIWVYYTTSTEILSWVIVNIFSLPLLILVVVLIKREKIYWGIFLSLFVTISRTVFDYLYSWHFYFP